MKKVSLPIGSADFRDIRASGDYYVEDRFNKRTYERQFQSHPLYSS